MRRLISARRLASTGIVAAVLFAWVHVLLATPPRLPISTADGTYFNKCCGALVLTKGLATAGHQTFYYTIEADKRGPYVMPTSQMVMADSNGLSVSPAKNPLELHLDASAEAKWIEVLGPADTFRFARQPG